MSERSVGKTQWLAGWLGLAGWLDGFRAVGSTGIVVQLFVMIPQRNPHAVCGFEGSKAKAMSTCSIVRRGS